jgi:hypothetical protein
MKFRRGHKSRKGWKHQAALGQGRPAKISTIGGRRARTKGRTNRM